MRKRPFFAIGVAAFSAALICALTTASIGVVAVSVTALCLLCLLFVRGVHPPVFVTVAACICALTVALLFYYHTEAVVQPQLALNDTTAEVTVRVEEKLSTENAYRVRVEQGTLPKGIRLCFWPAYHEVSPENGDLLSAQVYLIAAYDEQTESGSTAKANGVYLYAWPTEESDVIWTDGQTTLSLPSKALYALRRSILGTLYRRMSYDGAAFAQGMMLGQCGNIPMVVTNAFRASGVYHLLAVSGSHLVLITGVVFGLLSLIRSCSRRLRAVLTALVIVVFMALCGFTASVMRAGVMSLILLSGELFHRRADGLNSLGLAASVMLLADPFCMYDIGWQLSFAATVGLIVFGPVWQREIVSRAVSALPPMAAVLRLFGNAVGVTLCASVFTLPLSMWHFGSVSAVALLGNLVCTPLLSTGLLVTFLAVLTAWLTPFSNGLFAVSEWIGRVTIRFTDWLASVPFAMVSVHQPLIIVWMAALPVAVIVSYRLWRLRGVLRATAAMVMILMIGGGLYSLGSRLEARVAVAASDRIAVTVKADDTCGLIVTADKEALEKAGMLLFDEGITALDWVLWLGEPSIRTTDVSSLTLPIERLLTTAPAKDFMNLPQAKVFTTFGSGGTLTFAENGRLECCGGFRRLRIGDTVFLLASDETADASVLPPAWCTADVLLLQTVPENHERLRASQTVLLCPHSKQQTFKEAFPDAVIAVEGDTLVFPVHSPLREREKYDILTSH